MLFNENKWVNFKEFLKQNVLGQKELSQDCKVIAPKLLQDCIYLRGMNIATVEKLFGKTFSGAFLLKPLKHCPKSRYYHSLAFWKVKCLEHPKNLLPWILLLINPLGQHFHLLVAMALIVLCLQAVVGGNHVSSLITILQRDAWGSKSHLCKISNESPAFCLKLVWVEPFGHPLSRKFVALAFFQPAWL